MNAANTRLSPDVTAPVIAAVAEIAKSEEHTSELQSH